MWGEAVAVYISRPPRPSAYRNGRVFCMEEPEQPEPSAWVHEMRAQCWCKPDLICAECFALGPCLCDCDEVLVLHKPPA